MIVKITMIWKSTYMIPIAKQKYWSAVLAMSLDERTIISATMPCQADITATIAIEHSTYMS